MPIASYAPVLLTAWCQQGLIRREDGPGRLCNEWRDVIRIGNDFAVSEKTGDAVGGLLNATLGNLTELIIAITALRAGEYMLVKASIAGAIVTNSLFMLGASFLLGGLRYHVQEYNRAGGRMHSALLLMATIALLAPRRSPNSIWRGVR